MILTKTPFRISLAGGGSDLPAFYRRHPGAVVTSTVDKAMYIAIHPYFHDKIRIKYSRMEDVSSTSEIQHPLVRECLRQVAINRGMEIASFADVPAGTGMGSSSAFTVGLLHALYAGSGIQPCALRLAEEACVIELERVQEPIGKQDQYAVACGGMNFIRFHPDGGVEIEPVNCSVQTREALSQRLMLFYVGKERTAGSILAEQSRNMADKDKFNQVVQMAGLAEALRGALEKDNLDSLGDILDQGWQLKRGLAIGITNTLIDRSYRRAREAGAEGGKLLGAGAGGFLLLSCRPEKQQQVRQALVGLREMSVTLTAEGSRLLYDDGCNVPIPATKDGPDAEPQPISCANDSSGRKNGSVG
jgi:D-glycero-alpha-D-manno-heptose-7-phosphate kinase